MTPEGDIADFKKLFSDSQLRPDMLKIYPSLVIENTPLYDEYKQGKYIPYSDEDMIKVLIEAKKNMYQNGLESCVYKERFHQERSLQGQNQEI